MGRATRRAGSNSRAGGGVLGRRRTSDDALGFAAVVGEMARSARSREPQDVPQPGTPRIVWKPRMLFDMCLAGLYPSQLAFCMGNRPRGRPGRAVCIRPPRRVASNIAKQGCFRTPHGAGMWSSFIVVEVGPAS